MMGGSGVDKQANSYAVITTAFIQQLNTQQKLS